jgi:DNA topoisomerase-1
VTWVDRLHAVGILRRGSARVGFRYRAATGGRITQRERQRIRALHLPPGWRDVAINPSPHGRVQAVGRDRAGRWQYVYHPAHVRARERKKFDRLRRFGAALPRLRRALRRDLRARDLTRDRVLATIVRILACAFIRPGSEAYAAENGTYGIATLRRKHVTVSGDTVWFDFIAKGGKRQQCTLHERGVARVVRRLLALPGYEIFKYVDADGRVVDIKRADINDYIKRHMGDAFSAKDFRTWTATLICACALARAATECDRTPTATKRAIVAAIKETARRLGNTPAVCRASYVSPSVLAAYERGDTVCELFTAIEDLIDRGVRGLHAAERALLDLFERSAHGASAPVLRIV